MVNIRTLDQIEGCNNASIEEDIFFDKQRISTVIYKNIAERALQEIGELRNQIRALSKRIDFLEREKQLKKEEVLEKIWNNKDDEIWDTL